MTKTYFDLDKVVSITLNTEKESTYKWFQKTPSIPKLFMGIKYGSIAGRDAGWSDTSAGFWRYPTSYFSDYNWYRVDEVNKKVYSKAYVNLHLLNNSNIGTYFYSTEEAQYYIDELIEGSDREFHVIEN
mgnify:FL=1|tara:strand:- start:434 stop:820 length:387 start_codon:yes stop_codon:yes gene_type:complete